MNTEQTFCQICRHESPDHVSDCPVLTGEPQRGSNIAQEILQQMPQMEGNQLVQFGSISHQPRMNPEQTDPLSDEACAEILKEQRFLALDNVRKFAFTIGWKEAARRAEEIEKQRDQFRETAIWANKDNQRLRELLNQKTVILGFASWRDGRFELIIQDPVTGDETTLKGTLEQGQFEVIDKILPTCVYVEARAALEGKE